MRLRAKLGSMLLMIATLSAIGCSGTQLERKTQARQPWTGPTLPLDRVIGAINNRTAGLSTLWAAGTFELEVDDANKREFVNGDVGVNYMRKSTSIQGASPTPSGLRIIGTKVSKTVFDAGVTDARFWLSLPEGVETTWYGSLDAAVPFDDVRLPVRPDALLAALGWEPLPTDLIRPPVPVMRFNPDYDAYMITWSIPHVDRWVCVREIWFDRQTLEPRLVWVFDRDGRVIVRGRFLDYRNVDGVDVTLASRMELWFVESKSKLVLKLEDMRLKRGNRPSEASFRFDPARSGARNVVNLDAEQRP
jgi:hypothetical protein